ncbi:hypothetical protein LTR94_019905 [Friedmanniomyces endolithicus]|nr:hypothetical protein LTR94_019905 [Friedmanniomyces endolithicus]
MLAEIRRSQDLVRERVAKSSWSYDLVYSAVAAAFVGGQAAPMPFNVLASAAATLAFAILWRRWSEKTGVSVTGLSPRRARWVAIALGVVFLVLALASVYFGRTGQNGDSTVSAPVLDVVIHAPGRLQICAMLSAADEVEFGVVRDGIGVSDSVMSKHVKQLEEAGYVKLRKAALGGRQRTWLALTGAGRKAFAGHVAELTRLAGLAGVSVPG